MQLQIDDVLLDIISVGGLYTCVQFPNYKIAIDMGISPRSSFNKSHVFFTHTHGDHIAGVVRHCSSRNLMQLPEPTYIVGKDDAHNFVPFLEAAGKLNRSQMKYHLHAISPNERIDIRKDLYVKSYRSVHSTPCQGYIICETKKKLRSEYLGFTGKDIAELRKAGVDISEEIEIPIVTYTGDTTIDVFKREPQLQNVKILITEVTFWDDNITPAESKKRGHIHINDIVENAELFTQPHIVLMHASSRYSGKDMERIAKEKLPQDLFERLYFIPNDQPLEGF